jgi:hypothetical protein
MIRDFFRRHRLAILLAALLLLNTVRFWHRKHHPEAFRTASRLPGPPGDPAAANSFPAPDSAMRKRIEAALQKMPEEQRKAVEDRMKADRAFFESLRDLPEDQRREKIQEHFAQNPPPPGFDPGLPGAGGPGGGGDPGNGDPVHLPPPEIRRSMDQQIANSQKQMGGS